eukprot:3480418-Amphidinium_carterae.2
MPRLAEFSSNFSTCTITMKCSQQDCMHHVEWSPVKRTIGPWSLHYRPDQLRHPVPSLTMTHALAYQRASR